MRIANQTKLQAQSQYTPMHLFGFHEAGPLAAAAATGIEALFTPNEGVFAATAGVAAVELGYKCSVRNIKYIAY